MDPKLELITCEDKMIEHLYSKIKDMRHIVTLA